MNEPFKLEIISLHWIKNDGKDDENDLCAHGKINLKIANEVLSDEKSNTWTLSSAALFLMRSIIKDYTPGDMDSQLIPCCGHFFCPSEDGQSVATIGCELGVDWTITHIENNRIKHISQSGVVAIIDKIEYQKIVLQFAHQVEDLYNTSAPKVVFDDDFDRKGYAAFWNEWKRLKQQIGSEI